MFTLRGYQESSVNGVRDAYIQGYKAPLLVLPTGGGKTIVFSYIAANAANKGKKVLILVHRVELLKQTIAKLRGFGIRVGAISPKFSPDPSAPIQVAMVQTIINRLGKYSNFDLIITDECHHAISPTYVKIISYYTGVYQLGVTATPVRTDGRGLGVEAGGVYDKLVVGPSVSDLIGMGYLVEPVVYASQMPIDLDGVNRTSSGDYNKKKLSQKMDKPKLIGNVVKHYMDLARGEPGVAFCTSVQHAENVAADFRSQGFKFYCLSGKTEDNVRERLIRGLGDGSIHGLTSCDVISEGTDIPSIAVGMLLRPTESEGLYLQQVGRTLRPSEGKDRAIILDHAGNTFRHGFADDDREWSLTSAKRKKSRSKSDDLGPGVYQCKECYAVFKPTAKTCPHCGAERLFTARELEVIEGELLKIEQVEKERLRRERRKMVYEAKSLEDLVAVGKKMGYRSGWAKHIYKSRKAKESSFPTEKDQPGLFAGQ